MSLTLIHYVFGSASMLPTFGGTAHFCHEQFDQTDEIALKCFSKDITV